VETRLQLDILPQPTDSTCGPTCLHAVYAYYGDQVPLRQVVAEVVPLESGGTLAVHLACHALQRGYQATIYTYNLQLFDPTWFGDGAADLAARLVAQREAKDDARLGVATEAYLEFIDLGGRLRFRELSRDLLAKYLRRDRPILTGLSATYLYGCAREVGIEKLHYDDVRGHPTGHFVVLCGYDSRRREVQVADPLQDNPGFGSHYYTVGLDRVLGAVLLGVITYDANFLVLEPGSRKSSAS